MKPTGEDLELYVMGAYDGDADALERAIDADPAARAMLADEAGFEGVLREAAGAARFCAGCSDLVRGDRCEACGAAVEPGGYVVERVLVSNAHGRMYVARDADGRLVALKELAFVQTPTPAMVAAFEREAKFLRALEHPAIPRFCASFEEGRGVHVRYYLAQELVAGEALEARLATHWFDEAEIVAIARQVLGVLVYLQGLSPMVIHRDIKPANLIRRADGSIAVVDFGAAHVQGTTAGSTTIGTFGYMPVEQLAGLVDPTTDPYALGASLLHLLTRREPWRILQGGTSFDGLNVSRPMRAFLGKLVAPDPRDRFPSAAAALAALERVAGGDRAEPKRRRRWLQPAILAAASVGLAVTGVRAYQIVSRSHHHGAAIARMSEWRDRVCLCPDQACADKITREMTVWAQEMIQQQAEPPVPDEDVAEQMTAISAAMSKCMMTLYRAQLDRPAAKEPDRTQGKATAAPDPLPAADPQDDPGTPTEASPLRIDEPSIRRAKAEADKLYRSKRFEDAADLLRTMARSSPDKATEIDLRSIASVYDQLGRAYNRGMAATAPTDAYFDLRIARNLDSGSAGGAFTDEIEAKLGQVAPRAAISWLARKDYDKAFQAVRTAEQLGTANMDTKIVRQNLETSALQLYTAAAQEISSNRDAANAKLREIKVMVDPHSKIWDKADQLGRAP